MRATSTTRTGPVAEQRRRCRQRPQHRSDSHSAWTDGRGPVSTDNAGTYTYDNGDNLAGFPSGANLAHDAANQLSSLTNTAGTTTFGYDTRGNRTTITPPAGPATTLTYDHADRLTGHNTANATYKYTGDGLRMSKTIAGVTTSFTWNVAQGLPLLLVEGTTSYVYGPGGLPLQQITSGGQVTYYHQDQLGSTRALTNSAGAVVTTYTYDPYGKLAASTGTATNPFRYAGQYTDIESGLLYMRARYYDPGTATFLSRDPLEAQTGEPYGYVGGNPLNRTDPFGLSWYDPRDWDQTAVGWAEDRAEDAIGLAGDLVQASPVGQALDFASQATSHSIGICVGGNLFGGYDLMGSLCYMSTPSGEAGFTASAGGGGAGPYGVSGLVGLSVSNAQSGSGLAGTSAYTWASAGEGLKGVGMSGSFSGDCWQTTFGWGPGFRIPAPFAGGGGVGHTWTLGW